MNLSDRTLIQKLALVLALKLVVLFALWWWFVRDHGVQVDSSGVAAQLLQAAPLTTRGLNK